MVIIGILFTKVLIYELRMSSRYEDMLPSWFRGPFQASDDSLTVHFLYGGKVWMYTQQDRNDFEEFTWVLDSKRARVVRVLKDHEEEVGYAIEGTRDRTIEWFDNRTPTAGSIILTHVGRQGD